MGGTRATDRGDGHEPVGTDDPLAAEARHWRELATRREAALRTLTRRPLVRAALELDRRLAWPRRRLRGALDRARSAIDRLVVVLAGCRARPSFHGRRAAVAGVVTELAAPPSAPSTTVITLSGDRRALGDAVAAASGDVVCFTPDPAGAMDPDWLVRLTSPVHDGVVATTPTLLHPDRGGRRATEHDLLVRAAGFAIELDPSGAPVVEARAAGTLPAAGQAPADVAAAPLTHLAVDRRAFLAAGGLAATGSDDLAAIDLCMRLRARGGRIQHVPDALVLDARPVPSRTSLRHPVDPADAGWRALVEAYGPGLVAPSAPGAGPTRATRWVITTAVPSARLAPRWGDWHLAEALARALRALGQEVAVQTCDAADSLVTRVHDIHLVLHGLAPVRPTPGQRHVLWVISHPESVDPAECDAADLVLVASRRFADDLRRRTSTPVEVLLQATDPARFRPLPPDPRHEHPVTVVAKTRDVRAVVTDALAAGLRPAVYGHGWDDLIDRDLIVADHVDNDVLPSVYSSAGVVLNDHWDTMAAWGFVSNRIFDVLACGTPVISDDVPEIHDLFGDAVPTYRTATELGALVAEALDDPARARARAARGRAIVLEHHTFDHRAAALLDLVARHAPPAAPATLRGPGVR